MKFLGLILTFLFLASPFLATTAFACKLGPASKWYLAEPELEKVTKDIVVAKLIDAAPLKGTTLVNLKFQVSEVKKGKLTKKAQLYINNVQKTEFDSISYGKACNFKLNYKLNQDYLIYVGTLNPNSIKLMTVPKK